MVVNRKTGEFKSLFEFFNYEQFMKDVAVITDTARGKKLSYAQLAVAILRNFKAEGPLKDFRFRRLSICSDRHRRVPALIEMIE